MPPPARDPQPSALPASADNAPSPALSVRAACFTEERLPESADNAPSPARSVRVACVRKER